MRRTAGHPRLLEQERRGPGGQPYLDFRNDFSGAFRSSKDPGGDRKITGRFPCAAASCRSVSPSGGSPSQRLLHEGEEPRVARVRDVDADRRGVRRPLRAEHRPGRQEDAVRGGLAAQFRFVGPSGKLGPEIEAPVARLGHVKAEAVEVTEGLLRRRFDPAAQAPDVP